MQKYFVLVRCPLTSTKPSLHLEQWLLEVGVKDLHASVTLWLCFIVEASGVFVTIIL